jgi:DNA-binding response OmpR family regulator
MTANAMQGDREMCLQAGMDDYISKPIRSDQLVAALERAWTLKEPAVPIEPAAPKDPDQIDPTVENKKASERND